MRTTLKAAFILTGATKSHRFPEKEIQRHEHRECRPQKTRRWGSNASRLSGRSCQPGARGSAGRLRRAAVPRPAPLETRVNTQSDGTFLSRFNRPLAACANGQCPQCVDLETPVIAGPDPQSHFATHDTRPRVYLSGTGRPQATCR